MEPIDPYSLKPAIITNWMKVLMTFIDRVGFPVLAFLLMWWSNTKSADVIAQLNATLVTQTELLRSMNDRMERAR